MLVDKIKKFHLIKNKYNGIIPVMDSDELIKAIGRYILQGLSEKESALLCGLTEVDLENLKSKAPSLKDFLEKKKVEFKLNHLEVINKKSDPKTSQWLLEKICPEQFATRKNVDAPQNIFAVLVKEIQSNNNHELVKRIESVSSTANNTAESVQDFLK